MPRSVTCEDIHEYFQAYPVPHWSITDERILRTILQHLVGANRITCSYKDADFLTPKKVRETWPDSDRQNVKNFMRANSSFARIGKKYLRELLHPSRVEQHCPLLRLPDEILGNICEILSPTQRDLLPLWKFKAGLSVESFATLPPPPPPDIVDVESFRLTCQKFAYLGLANQFRAVQIRFSSESFIRLQELSMKSHIARVTTRVAYMVPRLYSKDRTQFEELLRICDQQLEPRIPARYRNDIVEAMNRADKQKTIVGEGIDSSSLLQALMKFRYLDQLRIMRVEDSIDARWVSFLESNRRHAGDLLVSEWDTAVEHAKTIILAALKRSNSPVHRISSRFIDPSIVLVNFTLDNDEDISKWARRLTSIELQLVPNSDPDNEILQMSQRFRELFSAASNIETFHVGSYNQISVPLDTIFHGMHVRKLQHLGLHLWLLDSEELLEFLQQHKSTIRSLRFRKVTFRRSLEEDELKWRKVLRFIRMNLSRLNWISLRDVNYEGAVPEYHAPFGLPAFGANHDSESASEDSSDGSEESDDDGDEDEEDDQEALDHESSLVGPDEEDAEDESEDESEEDDDESSAESEHSEQSEDLEEEEEEEEAEQQEYPSDLDDDHENERPRPHTTRCQCGNGYAWDDLVDNGTSVSRKQWKMWQIWAVNRCDIHDPPSDH
ncbi:hypothetical protein VTL71DRAFT_7606 [Oculimacula yallundae]|uniref:F-box domain-containing protein n=1 Tax=Oculimacula yallundae TaxID=86028 RepID=A0ABR4BUK1_9HELO